jgi:hypothetical protein
MSIWIVSILLILTLILLITEKIPIDLTIKNGVPNGTPRLPQFLSTFHRKT